MVVAVRERFLQQQRGFVISDMKKSIARAAGCLLILVGLVAAPGAGAQDRDETTARLERAMAKGDVKAIIAATPTRVAIAVFGASREYSRPQAEFVLRDFFSEYPPAGFTVSESSTTEQGAFIAGRYRSTRGGRDIDVYMRLRDRRGKWELREIIIRTEPR